MAWYIYPFIQLFTCFFICSVNIRFVYVTLDSLISGIPRGVVNVVYGKGEVLGRAMAAHPTVKALALVRYLSLKVFG